MKKILLSFLFALTLTALCACSRPAEPETVPETTLPAQTEPILISEPETEPETQPEEIPLSYDTVPLFFQTDYPYIPFGSGTIATDGCSLTCLSMIASYMTDHTYAPEELVYHFGREGKNNIERLEYAAQQLNLPYTKNVNWHETLQGLKEGKVAIIMEDQKSPFTTGQHFIVLSGLTEDGRVIVKDPYEPNYASPLLEHGFANGFHEYTITSGYSGGWVFDKSEMDPEQELVDVTIPEQPETRYVGYNLPEEDIYTLACLAWLQARDEPEEVQQAVVEVILNRLTSDLYPNTIDRVLYKSETFGHAKHLASADPGQPQYIAVTTAMYGPYVLPKDVLYYAPHPIDGSVWGQIGDYWFSYFEPEAE